MTINSSGFERVSLLLGSQTPRRALVLTGASLIAIVGLPNKMLSNVSHIKVDSQRLRAVTRLLEYNREQKNRL
jgi:hypothetical protein